MYHFTPLRKKYCLTCFIILLLALPLFGCGNEQKDKHSPDQTVSQQDSAVLIVTVPGTAETEEHQYMATVPIEGKSALALLEALGKEKNFPIICSSGYVTNIDGIAQFDKGPESGWLYLVNGKMPSVSADQYVPQIGDTINWIYLTSYDQLNNSEPLD